MPKKKPLDTCLEQVLHSVATLPENILYQAERQCDENGIPLPDVENLVERNIRRFAEARFSELAGKEEGITATSFAEALSDKGDIATALTVLAQGADLFRRFVNRNSKDASEQLEQLKQSLKLKTPSFSLPENEWFTAHQQFIHDFIRLAKESGGRKNAYNLLRRLGIREVQSSNGYNHYCALKLHDIEAGNATNASRMEPLNVRRNEIHAHLDVVLPRLLDALLEKVKAEHDSFAWARAAYYKEDYLNNYRKPFFALTAVADALRSVSAYEPLDLETKKPLTPRQCIDLCDQIDHFFDGVLGLFGKDKEKPWSDYIATSQILVKNLRKAYADEHMKEFPVAALATHARNTVQTATEAFIALVYQHPAESEKKQEDETKRTANLQEQLRGLRRWLRKNNNILEPFRARANQLPKDVPFLNERAETLIDVLIVYCHLPRKERLALRGELTAQKNEPAGRFERVLAEFDEQFIRPLNHVLKKKQKKSPRTNKERAEIIGRRLVPCLTLFIDAFQVDVDTKESYHMAQVAQESSDSSESDPDELPPSDESKLSQQRIGKAQYELINMVNQSYLFAKAQERFQGIAPNSEEPYFLTSAVAISDARKVFAKRVDLLPPKIYKMSQIALLLEELQVLHAKHPYVLQYRAIQGFLKKCITKVKDAHEHFQAMFENAEIALSEDQRINIDDEINRKIKYILWPIMQELQESLEEFEKAAIEVEKVISKPEFVERERTSFFESISFIHEKFYEAFYEASGIENLFNKNGSYDSRDKTGSVPLSPLRRQGSNGTTRLHIDTELGRERSRTTSARASSSRRVPRTEDTTPVPPPSPPRYQTYAEESPRRPQFRPEPSMAAAPSEAELGLDYDFLWSCLQAVTIGVLGGALLALSIMVMNPWGIALGSAVTLMGIYGLYASFSAEPDTESNAGFGYFG